MRAHSDFPFDPGRHATPRSVAQRLAETQTRPDIRLQEHEDVHDPQVPTPSQDGTWARRGLSLHGTGLGPAHLGSDAYVRSR